MIPLAVAFVAVGAPEGGPSSYELYRQGQSAEGLALAKVELNVVEAGDDRTRLWSQLMHVAWLEESLGLHREAIRHATRALELADDAYREGRSLCWLGWSYTSLGLYPLALELYGGAIARGTRDDEILHPGVWGLATQETGALFARMGDLKAGAALLRVTTDYARRHDIPVGVSEGGAHLAAIALAQGRLEEAETRADEALRASLRCDCSPYNTGRARLVDAGAALLRARSDPKFLGVARQKIRNALEQAERVGDRRHVAEAKLLLSRAIDADDFDARLALVSSAVETLQAMESELRGTSEARLGSLFLEQEQHDLAEIYLRNGLRIDEQLFRDLDRAYSVAELADIEYAAGETERPLAQWAEAAEQAERSTAWPLVADASEKIARELHALGYLRLAVDWSSRGLVALDAMSEREPRPDLVARRLELAERIAEVELTLARQSGSDPSRPGP